MLSWKVCIILSVIGLSIVTASPMMYKKNVNDNYEPDLVAVSSTVIPLTVYEVSAGFGVDKGSEFYKKMYLKHIHKKVHELPDDPDTLITIKKNYNEKKEKANVKSV